MCLKAIRTSIVAHKTEVIWSSLYQESTGPEDCPNHRSSMMSIHHHTQALSPGFAQWGWTCVLPLCCLDPLGRPEPLDQVCSCVVPNGSQLCLTTCNVLDFKLPGINFLFCAQAVIKRNYKRPFFPPTNFVFKNRQVPGGNPGTEWYPLNRFILNSKQ